MARHHINLVGNNITISPLTPGNYAKTSILTDDVDVGNGLGAISLKGTSLTYDGAAVWATSAQLNVAGISTGAITADSLVADSITANTTLIVSGVDVGQWIADCATGASAGCTP
jgi:hypothetical protein